MKGSSRKKNFSYICETEDSFQVSVCSARSIAEQRETFVTEVSYSKGHWDIVLKWFVCLSFIQYPCHALVNNL